MFNEPKTIPEDLMLELEEAIEKVNKLFSKVRTLNERNMTAEWREEDRQMRQDYERGLGC